MLDTARARRLLSEFQFEPLFIEELGWDRYGGHLDVAVDGSTYRLKGVAEKRGMVAFLLAPDGDLPDRSTRRKIDQQAARYVHEHLIVYVDAAQTSQIWQWVRREPGQPAAVREHFYREVQSGEALVQKLDALAFSLDEEAELSLVEVTRRARAAFDVERITKRFYDRFKAEHDAFLGFIDGLASQDDLEWYASVTLNRLMFIYFIQKKGFLDGDRDYLRDRLRAIRLSAGPDQFHSFYRHFLLRLFHEGLGSRERTTELDALLGRVPYLNGGLFDVHELEAAHPSIEIPDDAFERLFDFFDSYQWYLDDRPLRADDEINPDVLGYIFEKYVNQKQMGAYYSKEDITDYITSNTLLPRLLEKVATSPEFSFDSIRELLAEDPDRFIHPSLSHAHGEPLPETIAQGMAAVDDRTSWDQPADQAFRLHRSDTWRDVVTRRQRYEATRSRLLARELHGPADLVTLNLRLHSVIEELIASCDSSSLLHTIYLSLESLSVLDPTCGSGAFLFAALNILEPLYEGVIDRMAVLLRERGDALVEAETFRSIIDRVDEHPSRSFFILKTITINNLYGVDILEEAVEICKLRLFLRLVSQIDRVGDLEPLPDIDFNVRAGNSLVGYATANEVRASFEELSGGQRKLIFGEAASDYASFEKRLEATDATFRAYQEMQTADASESAITETKHSLRDQLATLATELNDHLASDYGVDPARANQYANWKASHQPFHWFAEFYGIVSGGGFDVIIGNPPYVEYAQVAATYAVRDEEMVELGNLHAMVTQRCLRLLAEDGALGLVVPVALPSTSRFEGLRAKLLERAAIWTSHYDFRPSKLFEGAEQRLTIFLRHPADAPALRSTRFNRWYADERSYLFGSLKYTLWDEGRCLRPVWPKLPSEVGRSVLEKVSAQRLEIAQLLARGATSLFYKNTGMLYFTMFTRAAPVCFINGEASSSSRETQLRVRDRSAVKPLHALLNSSLFYVMYVVHSNCRDLNPSDIHTFRLPESVLLDERLQDLSDALNENHQANSEMRVRRQKLTGEVQIQTFQPARSKPILDEIDRVLASHYGFTDEEADFVTNYDAKYRFGGDET